MIILPLLKKSSKLLLLTLMFFSIHMIASCQMRQVYLDSNVENQMVKLSFYSPSEGYVAFQRWIGYTQDSGKTYSKKYITPNNVNYNGYSVNLTFGFNINGVRAINKNNLIVYGDYGLIPAILYSINGGDNFKLIFQLPYDVLKVVDGVTDMVFPQNNNIGFATDNDRLLKTLDDGLTWAVIRTEVDGAYGELVAVDNNTVFAFSKSSNKNKLIKTINGGTSWQTVAAPVLNDGKMGAVTFLNASTGWLSMYDANNSLYFYKTTDGGNTWGLLNNPDGNPFGSYIMKFTDINTGYALTGLTTVYKTLNGGVTWEPLPRDNNYSYLGYFNKDLQCLNGNQLWTGGGHGFVEMSSNGGGTPNPKAYFKIDTTGVDAYHTVKMINFSNPAYLSDWYVNNLHIGTSYNISYIHLQERKVDTIMLIVRSGSQSDTLIKNEYFTVPNLPLIASFFPATGSSGTLVTITGKNFTNVTAVKFGDTNASSFSVYSENIILATVAAGATGNVSVTDSHGTSSMALFTYYAPPTGLAPTVTSFAPAAGIVGTAVTISGNNFGSGATGNIIYFGDTRAKVTSANATQLVCTVPIGANFRPISILNTTTHLSGTSLKPFNVTFADSSNFTTHSFVQTYKYEVPMGMIPFTVMGKDIDGDGKPDLISTMKAYGNDSIYISRNMTTVPDSISFGERMNMAMIGRLSWGTFDVNDLDGDGRPDIVATSNSNQLVLLQNQSIPGAISFKAPVSIKGGYSDSWGVAVDDIDGDGRNDIAVADVNNFNISVIRNTSVPGFLSFAEQQTFIGGSENLAIAIGDIDGDGKKDVVSLGAVADLSTSFFSCFRNVGSPGNIALAPKVDFVVKGSCTNNFILQLVDFDNDNKLDVVVMNNNNRYIYKNTSTPGNIAFDAPILFSTGLSHGGAVAGLSGKNKPDIASGGDITVFGNQSTPDAVSTDVPVTNSAYGVWLMCASDFNLDGKVDILTSVNATNQQYFNLYQNKIGVPILQKACTGGLLTIATDYTGAMYQWQKDDGSGFTNLKNDTVITGTATSSITITNTPYALNGSKFRCVIDGNRYSSVFMLKLTRSVVPVVTISTPDTIVCRGTIVPFTTSSVISGVNNVSYEWQINGVAIGPNAPAFSPNWLQNHDQVKLVMTSYDSCFNGHSSISNTVTMTMDGAAPSVTITSSAQTFCAGSSATFTALPVNGGDKPVYQWKINGVNSGANGAAFTTSLVNGDQVTVTLTNSTTCSVPVLVTSNTITATVSSPVVPAVVISTPDSTVCTGSQAIFTAAPVNEGLLPTYQWQINEVNAGQNAATFATSSLKTGDVVRVVMNSSAACILPVSATSNTLALTVSSTVLPAVAVITPLSTVCAGSAVTFTAVPVNGGNAPIYQWQVNGVNGGANSSIFTISAITNESQVSVKMTSAATCAIPASVTSNPVKVSINSSTASVSITTPLNSACIGTSLTFTAVPQNGGTDPTYQWQVNAIAAGTNSATFTSPSIKNGDAVNVIMTSSAVCATPAKVTSNAIMVSFKSVTPMLSISAASTNICVGAMATFTAAALNGGSNPLYNWKINGTSQPGNSANFTTNILQDGDLVSAILTSNADCLTQSTAYSNNITMLVGKPQLVTIGITGNTAVSQGNTAHIITNVSFAGTSSTYKWQDSTVAHGWKTINGQSGTSIDYKVGASGDAVSCTLTSNAVCLMPDVVSNALYFTVDGNRIISFPNPVTGVLTLTGLEPIAHWETVELTDLAGNNKLATKNIINQTIIKIDITNLPSGTYIILLRSKQGKPAHLKIIKM